MPRTTCRQEEKARDWDQTLVKILQPAAWQNCFFLEADRCFQVHCLGSALDEDKHSGFQGLESQE